MKNPIGASLKLMKVTIPRLKLLSLIGTIQNVVPPKPAMPVLANVLIEAIDDQLIISATDLKVSVRAYADRKLRKKDPSPCLLADSFNLSVS